MHPKSAGYESATYHLGIIPGALRAEYRERLISAVEAFPDGELNALMSQDYGPKMLFPSAVRIDRVKKSATGIWRVPTREEGLPDWLAEHHPGGHAIVPGVTQIEAVQQLGVAYVKRVFPGFTATANEITNAKFDSQMVVFPGDKLEMEIRVVEERLKGLEKGAGRITVEGSLRRKGMPPERGLRLTFTGTILRQDKFEIAMSKMASENKGIDCSARGAN